MSTVYRDDVPIIGTNSGHNQSLWRGLLILEAFRRDTPELGVRELGRALGLNKTIVHRLVRTLADRGFLEQSPVSGKYRIGPRAFEVGQIYVTATALHEAVLPELRAIAHEHRLNAALAVLHGRDVIHLLTLQSSEAVVLRTLPGSRAPAHATAVGKVLLAAEPEGRLEELLGARPLPRFTPATIVDVEELKAQLREVRRNGYAIADEENYASVFAVGAPVRDGIGQVVAAISGACPRYALTDDRIPSIVRVVVESAARVSRSLGGDGSGPATSRPESPVPACKRRRLRLRKVE